MDVRDRTVRKGVRDLCTRRLSECHTMTESKVSENIDGPSMATGGHGVVRLYGKDTVVKTVRINDHSDRVLFSREVYFTGLAGGCLVGPALEKAWLDGSHGHIVMQQVGKSISPSAELSDRDWKQILDKVRALHEVGILHNDLFLRNILRSDDGTFHIIDFGSAWYYPGGVPRTLRAAEVMGLVCGYRKYARRSRIFKWTQKPARRAPSALLNTYFSSDKQLKGLHMRVNKAGTLADPEQANGLPDYQQFYSCTLAFTSPSQALWLTNGRNDYRSIRKLTSAVLSGDQRLVQGTERWIWILAASRSHSSYETEPNLTELYQ